MGQYFNSSTLSVCILAVFESNVPIDDSEMLPLLDTLFLPINPCFSSIMIKDERGVQQWRRVKVNLADHIKVPVFPAGLSPLAYDKLVHDYMSKVGTDRLPESRPLWQLHMIKYPTSHGEGTVMFKLHHALGDGYSLLSALFSCVKRADDPSLPLTFPMNDIICGIILDGIQLYMQRVGDGSKSTQATALVLLNTRFIHNYKNPKEMAKPDAEFSWGNRFGFLHVSIPTRDGPDKDDPLKIISEVKQLMNRKKSSREVFLTAQLLDTMRRFRGPEVAAQYIHSTLKNTSLSITTLIGPKDKMSLTDHPVRSFHFMVVGVPQSLVINMVSYMGKLKVAMGIEKGFIDAKLLTTCMEKAFEGIYEAALEEKP
ncbi:hypothetical protein QJS04_geneDACA012862 [Acorus gramineus]|uniref:Diacylglycerol O-acyltransferase n=1 Tax=Acorus gramineus TaxID=55184 RepID=A0AAV9BDU7_ACOGR|nr:hypothetical protein QJS04_geneDACA012862 [Acorus gramineus]